MIPVELTKEEVQLLIYSLHASIEDKVSLPGAEELLKRLEATVEREETK